MSRRTILIAQALCCAAAFLLIAITARPYDGWDYLGLFAFAGVGLTTLLRLRRL
ncbi:MAG TPA: hypothetical protein VLK25_01920 [Allosphingosinicella sp.]|nr:hypothetical protein [Allosphingosinicella sp.]